VPRVQHGKGPFDAGVEAQCWLCWGGTDCSTRFMFQPFWPIKLPLALCCHCRPHHLETHSAMRELHTVALFEAESRPSSERAD
jgi:hypothetical protein